MKKKTKIKQNIKKKIIINHNRVLKIFYFKIYRTKELFFLIFIFI